MCEIHAAKSLCTSNIDQFQHCAVIMYVEVNYNLRSKSENDFQYQKNLHFINLNVTQTKN